MRSRLNILVATAAMALVVPQFAMADSVEDQLKGIREAIIKRLTVSKKDEKGGLRYKSRIKDDIKRQNYYKEIAKENLKHGQDAFENALRTLISEGKIESEGKYLKLKR